MWASFREYSTSFSAPGISIAGACLIMSDFMMQHQDLNFTENFIFSGGENSIEFYVRSYRPDLPWLEELAIADTCAMHKNIKKTVTHSPLFHPFS